MVTVVVVSKTVMVVEEEVMPKSGAVSQTKPKMTKPLAREKVGSGANKVKKMQDKKQMLESSQTDTYRPRPRMVKILVLVELEFEMSIHRLRASSFSFFFCFSSGCSVPGQMQGKLSCNDAGFEASCMWEKGSDWVPSVGECGKLWRRRMKLFGLTR